MIRFTSSKFNHVSELHEYQLENGDTILITVRERNDDDLLENTTFDSVNEKKYVPVFADREYNDEPLELIGFELA